MISREKTYNGSADRMMNAAVVGRARETTTSEMRRREEVRVENEDDWTIEDWPLISPPLQLSVKS